MVPPDKIHEFVNKPDNQVNSLAAIREDLSLHYQGDMDIDADPIHHEVVRHQLTRKLPLLTEAVHQELRIGCEAEWSGANEKEWINVPAFKSCARIVSRAANRVFCEFQRGRRDRPLPVTDIYCYEQVALSCVEIPNSSMLPWDTPKASSKLPSCSRWSHGG